MNVQVTIIFSLISVIIAVVSFFIGQKKSSKDDGMTLGKFMGEIKAEISSLKEKIDELKSDHKEVDGKIKEAIAEHVKVYHENK